MIDAHVILPSKARRGSFALAGALILAGFLLSSVDILAMSSEGANPGDDRLVLEPLYPRPGEAVTAVYRPVDRLDNEHELHLRARTRMVHDEPYNWDAGSQVLAVLERRPDGTFAGSFALPPGVVYARLAVENVSATIVDSRAGAFWEILSSHDGYRPSNDALSQRFDDLMGRDMRAVYETSVWRAELYPDRPDVWTSLISAERWYLGETEADSRRDAHLERAGRLHALYVNESGVDADIVGSLYWYGLIIDDEAMREHWRERLQSENPGHFFTIQDRMVEAFREHQADPQELLPILETLWHQADDERGRSRVTRTAFQAAHGYDETETFVRWADRYAESGPSVARMVARTLARRGDTADLGLRRLAKLAATFESALDEARPLGMTADAHRRSFAQQAAGIRTDVARIHHEAGRHADAVSELEAITGADWNSQRFQLMADALLALGDHDAAAGHLAFVAVDPATDNNANDSLRALSGLDESAWIKLVTNARGEMYRRTLAEAVLRDVGPLTLRASDGAEADPDAVFGETATVIVVWSRNCGASVQTMPNVAMFAREQSEDVRVVAITNQDPEESEAHVVEQGWDVSRYYDPGGASLQALNSWGTPEFFLLDGEGRLRYTQTGLETLPRQIVTLRAEREGVVH